MAFQRKITPGISKKNIEVAAEKMAEAIGQRWVSKDPAVLSCYFRDFTPTVGKRPNIVALPATTEDVKKVVDIAREHHVPLVPVSTGFNHAGLTLPRLGGVLIDLKRMDKIEVDGENMTVAVGPHARNAAVHACVNEAVLHGNVRLRPCLPLTMGSCSMLANYVARGGSGIVGHYGYNVDLIIDMTWVLPDGTVLKTGPNALPWVEGCSAQYGPGPEISGMFLGADGMFGVCTEMTIRCVPDYPVEEIFIFEAKKKVKELEQVCEFIYDLSHTDIHDFMYKMHHGSMACTMQGVMPDLNPEEIAEVLPNEPVLVMLAAGDEEELAIKKDILMDIAHRNGLYEYNLTLFGDLPVGPTQSKKIGPTVGGVMRHRGAFQWIACGTVLEKIPQLQTEFELIMEKYYMGSDPDQTMKKVLSGSAIQGPYLLGRLAPCEFDFWWDQGNPEDVKRASKTMERITEMFIKHEVPCFRVSFGHGHLVWPHFGKYGEILRKAKRVFDPENLSHPDLHPVTDTFI